MPSSASLLWILHLCWQPIHICCYLLQLRILHIPYESRLRTKIRLWTHLLWFIYRQNLHPEHTQTNEIISNPLRTINKSPVHQCHPVVSLVWRAQVWKTVVLQSAEMKLQCCVLALLLILVSCYGQVYYQWIRFHHPLQLHAKIRCAETKCPCPASNRPVCGSDLITYDNLCLLKCTRSVCKPRE